MPDVTNLDDQDQPCKLLAGDISFLVQACLFLFGVVILLFKRSKEQPKRPLKIWMLDVSKQGFSSITVHFVAIAVAITLSNETHGDDECAWYLLTFSTDVVVGTSLSYLLIQLVERVAKRRNWTALMHTGDYGSPVNMVVWMKQVFVWVLICVVARLGCATVLFAFRILLNGLARAISSPFRHHPDMLLLLVMLVCPVALNLTQLWIQDTFLKKAGVVATGGYDEVQDLEEELQPLSEREFYEEIVDQ